MEDGILRKTKIETVYYNNNEEISCCADLFPGGVYLDQDFPRPFDLRVQPKDPPKVIKTIFFDQIKEGTLEDIYYSLLLSLQPNQDFLFCSIEETFKFFKFSPHLFSNLSHNFLFFRNYIKKIKVSCIYWGKKGWTVLECPKEENQKIWTVNRKTPPNQVIAVSRQMIIN